MITTEESARLLGVSRSRVLELIKSGQLKAEKMSGVWLVDEESVIERNRTVNKKGGRPRRGEGRGEAKFTFMNRTHEVCEVVYDRSRKEFTVLGKLFDETRAPIGLAQNGLPALPFQFNDWWKGRGIPRTRDGVSELLREAGVDVPDELLQRNLGLSLSDQYWIRPQGSGLRWEDVNFFNNDFEQVDARTAPYALEGEGAHAHPDNTSDGNLCKFWVVRDGVRMLRKGGRYNGQEPYNEVVATALYRRLLQEDEFVPYVLDGEGPDAWCLCPDFLTDEEEYVPAVYVERLKVQDPTANDFDHFVECCEALGIGAARSALERMITCDDMMANHDRHHRNFGIVRNVETLECRPAPVFDSGASLWCDDSLDKLARGDFDFSSRQFDHRPARQLLLVEDFSWFDIAKMDGFVDEAMDILAANDALEKRLPYIREGLTRRVERMIDIVEWS